MTGCTTAFVAGEPSYAPSVFDAIRPLLMEEGGRIGGVGVKIHPTLRYGSLYHWLLGDPYYRRGNTGWELPHRGWPYSTSAASYR